MPPMNKKVLCRVCKCVTENADGYCDDHRKDKTKIDALRDLRRGSPSSRGYDRSWVNFRKHYLREHPLCIMCETEGRVIPATEIHHIKMLRKGGDKYADENLMPLCHSCHSRITAEETGFRRQN